MELFNTIHKALIGLSIIAAFIHYIVLYVKAFKKMPLMEDFSKAEFKRVLSENKKHGFSFFSLFGKAGLIFLLWAVGILSYFIIMMKLGWIW